MSATLHPKYRRDIDGLRAVAILMVMAFHAFPALLPGGFIGVDIFFVISGYLISTIIFTNLEHNSFSFTEFYARRIKRIFPAMLLVIATSLIAGWLFFFPQEWHELGKNAFNCLLFISNIALIKRVGYFDPALQKNPLLHFWSLCVEEQFYLLWPLMAVAVFKRNRKVLTLLVACIGLSFLLNILLIYSQPVADFYLPLTRFWELLAGGFLARLTMRHSSLGHYLASRYELSLQGLNELFSFGGTSLILVGAFLISNTEMFPGFLALLPVLGAFLIIDAGEKAWLNQHLLSNKLMVGIGLISYPLYLWHWPILSFARIVTPVDLSVLQLIKLLGLSFILAMLTYFLLEKPLRGQNKTRALIITALIILLASTTGYYQLVTPRSAIGKKAIIANTNSDWLYPGDFNFNKTKDYNFLVSNKTGHDSVLVIGDSHAEQYWVRLNKKVNADPTHSPALLFATYGGCPPLIGMDHPENAEYCDDFYHFTMDFAKKNPVTTVVFGAYWEKYFGLVYSNDLIHSFTGENRQKMNIAMARFKQDLMTLHQQGKKIFIVLSNPTAPVFDPRNMINRFNGKISVATLNKKAWLEYTAPVRQALQEVAAQSGATTIDPLEELCSTADCPTVDENGRPMYKDIDHLSRAYMLQHADYIDTVLAP